MTVSSVPCTIPDLLHRYSGRAFWRPADNPDVLHLYEVSILIVMPRRVDIFHGLDENGMARVERSELELELKDGWLETAQVCRWAAEHDQRWSIAHGPRGGVYLSSPRGVTLMRSPMKDNETFRQLWLKRRRHDYWFDRLASEAKLPMPASLAREIKAAAGLGG